jgi:thymidylate kinase
VRGPVIAISGPPGSGKTALAHTLAGRVGAACVEYDLFETFTRTSPAGLIDWLARGAPYDEIMAPGLASRLRQAAARGPVVFDTPLGRAHPETGPLIDFAVWIDCPPDLALKRKLAQLAAAVPDERAAEFLRWLDGYLEAYETLVRPACIIQADRLAGTADVTVDGTDSLLRSADVLQDALYHLRRGTRESLQS